MSTDTETKTDSLVAALADLQTQLPQIAKSQTADVKTKTGAAYKYTYANLAQISREALPLMGKLGLSWVTMPMLNADGKLVLRYQLSHISGDQISGEYPLKAGGTPQEIGSEITYARRYCLCAVTGIAPEDDDDDAAAAQVTARSRRRRSEASDDEQGQGITVEQQREMRDLFRAAQISDKAAMLRYAVETIDRPLGSATEMTRDEAARVSARLAKFIAQQEPPAGDPA